MTRWENERVRFLFLFSLLFFLKNSVIQTLTDENAQEVMQEEKAGLKCWKTNQQKKTTERFNNEPQNNVTLRKVGAGKATGRACRLKQEQNGGLCDEQNGASNQNASVSVCVCLCVCVRKRRERGRGNKEEGAERTSRETNVHTWAWRLSGNSKVKGI